MRIVLAGFCVLLTLLPGGRARAVDGPEVIRRLQAQFEGLRTLSARIEKRHYWKLAEQTQEITGRVYVEKPDRFRLETRLQTVVTDGTTAWLYTPANEQVVVQHYGVVKEDRSYEKLLFDLILLGGYTDRYESRYAGEARVDGKTCHVVELTAHLAESYISRIRLWVDRKEWLVRRVEYLNINEDVTTYELSDLRVNKGFDEGFFGFEMPRDVEVVDLR